MGGVIHWIGHAVTHPFSTAASAVKWTQNAIGYFVTMVLHIFTDVTSAWSDMEHAAADVAEGVYHFARSIGHVIEFITEWMLPALIHDPAILLHLLERDGATLVKRALKDAATDMVDVAGFVDGVISDVF